jgi:ADP-heptose:LPS heptosyltransferase
LKYSNVNTEYLGKTSYNTLAFLIQNSCLHLGFDSLPVHIASHYQKKIVALYPHYIANTGPYFSEQKDVVLFEGIRYCGLKPVFAQDDPFSIINKIPSKHISEAVLHLLDIEENEFASIDPKLYNKLDV